MRYKVHIGPVERFTHSALPVTHCLVGKRRDDFERPSEDILHKSNLVGKIPSELMLTQEQRIEVTKYRYLKGDGKYALQALTWVCSDEEGGQAKLLFKEPEWDQQSFQLIPVASDA